MRFQKLAAGMGLLALLGGGFTAARAADGPFPSLQTVRQVVERHFGKKVDFRRGDLICRSDVEPIFDELIALGWPPADVESAYDEFPPDNAVLVQELQTRGGRAFMRQVSHLPGVYDRLERLSWLTNGDQVLRRMIADAQGPEQLRLMTTPAGMKAVEAKLAKDPRGKNFSIPTGHIHTVDQLLKSLEAAHAAAVADRQGSR